MHAEKYSKYLFLHKQIIYHYQFEAINLELLDHIVEVIVHRLQNGVLLEEVPLVLLVHSLGNDLHGGKVVHGLLLVLPDPSSNQQLRNPWDLESCDLGGEGEEPAHEAHLARVVHGGGHFQPGLDILLCVFLQQDQVPELVHLRNSFLGSCTDLLLLEEVGGVQA